MEGLASLPAEQALAVMLKERRPSAAAVPGATAVAERPADAPATETAAGAASERSRASA